MTPSKSNVVEATKNNSVNNSFEKFLLDDLGIDPHEKDVDHYAEELIENLNEILSTIGIVHVKQHIQLLLKLPHIETDIMPLSWSDFYKSSLSSKLRDFKKWNELKDILIGKGLLGTKVIQNNGKNITRHFRLFKLSSNEN